MSHPAEKGRALRRVDHGLIPSVRYRATLVPLVALTIASLIAGCALVAGIDAPVPRTTDAAGEDTDAADVPDAATRGDGDASLDSPGEHLTDAVSDSVGDSSGSCTPLPTASFTCGTTGSSLTCTSEGFCQENDAGFAYCATIPPSCDCVETYDCTCVLSQLPMQCKFGGPAVGCTSQGGHVFVQCTSTPCLPQGASCASGSQCCSQNCNGVLCL